MNTGKNRVKGLKTELFKKKYQTDPTVKNPTDMLGIPDITKDISKSLPSKGTPYDWGTAKEPNVKLPEFNPVTIDTKAEEAKPEEVKVINKESNWRDYVRAGLGVVSAAKGIYDDVESRKDIAERIQSLNDRPRYMPNEYENMGRPGSQTVIYAKHGAEIRTGTNSGAEEAELEQGEMFMMPNLDTYIVGGKKHSQGGEDFVLPQGTIVFSDHLKVPGVGKTFAEQAKKFDITKYRETIENPHAKAVDRNTAEIMMNRNMKKLQELFQIQQSLNGNSNGEVGEGAMRKAQAGMYNRPFVSPILTPQQQQVSLTNADMFGKEPPLVLAPEMREQFVQQQGLFGAPPIPQIPVAPAAPVAEDLFVDPTLAQMPNKPSNVSPSTSANTIPGATPEDKKSFAQEVQQIIDTKEAALAGPNKGNFTGGTEQPVVNTASNIIGATQGDPSAAGTVGMTNAADPNSMYYKTLPNGRKVFVENQGEFKGKSLRDQYGGDVFNLVRNRLNESYDELNPKLLSAYQMQLKDKKLMVGTSDQLVDIMESGNNSLASMRNFYKTINMEEMLFDPQLDKSKDNEKQKKTAELFKNYVESPQFLADVQAGKASTYLPLLKNQPTEVKDPTGKVIGYKLDNPEMNPEFIQKYQAAYRAFGGVKESQKKAGKDLLRGFRIAPEGLSDNQWMGLPISPVDEWGGNTTIGQVTAFEDEEAVAKKEKPAEIPKKTKDAGKIHDTKLTEATKNEYTKAPFDTPQLAPEFYGLAASQMFAYSPMDYNAPYVMPQTLNIQPQLQDIDNSYMAALNAGADPNAALIATLGAKQRIFSEKQNFDAQQRAAADQTNASARWQEDFYDMQSLDRVYNTLIAQADDAVTAQRQDLVRSASNKRNLYNMEENKKKLYIDNFVRNYKIDGKTGSMVINNAEGYDPFLLAQSYYEASKTEAAKKEAESKSETKTTTTK